MDAPERGVGVRPGQEEVVGRMEGAVARRVGFDADAKEGVGGGVGVRVVDEEGGGAGAEAVEAGEVVGGLGVGKGEEGGGQVGEERLRGGGC